MSKMGDSQSLECDWCHGDYFTDRPGLCVCVCVCVCGGGGGGGGGGGSTYNAFGYEEECVACTLVTTLTNHSAALVAFIREHVCTCASLDCLNMSVPVPGFHWCALNRSTINTALPQPEVQLPVGLHSVNMIPKHACDQCGKIFTRKGDLQIWILNTTRMVWNMNVLIVEKHLIARTTWNSINPSAKPFNSSVPDVTIFYGI